MDERKRLQMCSTYTLVYTELVICQYRFVLLLQNLTKARLDRCTFNLVNVNGIIRKTVSTSQ
ncbi:hypothetical protein X777_04424 [Ooceraea biroi]|uniref:Uncharacterized protein n=1 Tax=Ooceraea biroi TaxID=2015173 RepID=A0A026WH09_OOCBI|nr:hypothetical protein X777_04424 [Ooceraea biroi]